MTFAFLLTAYFWIMSIYLGASMAVKLLTMKKPSAQPISRGMWVEEISGYALLIIGLIGVYGHVHATPFWTAIFWQGFVLVFGLFAGLQYFMPKTQYLRQRTNQKMVVAAIVVGILLLVPMFSALIPYAFYSPDLWGQA